MAMGGGIWSMHFIAMLALRTARPVTYDIVLTLTSLLLAIAVTSAGFASVARMGVRLRNTAIGGAFMGMGIVGMHYTGMAAMRMTAHIRYDGFLVALSVLIAIGAATVALWLARRPQALPNMLVAAMAMGLAIAGMHYTGMAAASFVAEPDVDNVHDHLSALEQGHLAVGIGGTTILLLLLALTASSYDRRIAEVVEREATALRRADQRLRILLQGVTDYAIYLLDLDGCVASWNMGAQRIKGYTEDEIIGRHFSCFYPPEDITVIKVNLL
jgi:NO-binding membrane sensor protein with MHYT domain